MGEGPVGCLDGGWGWGMEGKGAGCFQTQQSHALSMGKGAGPVVQAPLQLAEALRSRLGALGNCRELKDSWRMGT